MTLSNLSYTKITIQITENAETVVRETNARPGEISSEYRHAEVDRLPGLEAGDGRPWLRVSSCSELTTRTTTAIAARMTRHIAHRSCRDQPPLPVLSLPLHGSWSSTRLHHCSSTSPSFRGSRSSSCTLYGIAITKVHYKQGSL